MPIGHFERLLSTTTYSDDTKVKKLSISDFVGLTEGRLRRTRHRQDSIDR